MKTKVPILLVALALLFLSACSAPFTAIGTTAGGLIGGSRGGTKGALLGAGAGMLVGAVADTVVYGPRVFQPRPAYANGRYYGYGVVSCSELPTMAEQDRCERAAQRSAERERERELRERLYRAERIGDELGRSRW